MRGLVLLLAASCWAQDQAVIPGPGVFGRSNLTTVGAVPYVSAVGTLSSSQIEYLNGRVGINGSGGTGSVSANRTLTLFQGDTNGSHIGMINTGAGGKTWFMGVGENVSDASIVSPGGFYLYASGSGSYANTILQAFNTTGNFVFSPPSTITDSGYKVDIAKSGTVGTARFYDSTPTTGVTKMQLRQGAGQAVGDRIWRITDSSGVNDYLYIDGVANPAIHGGTWYTLDETIQPLKLYNSSVIVWSTTNSSDSGSYDLGINRVGTRQQVEISNSAAGSTRDLRYRQAETSVGTVASATTISGASYSILHVTGTTTIQTITAPSAFSDSAYGGCITIIPDGLWATNTSGNIAIASTAVVSKAMLMCYDHSTTKWYPSY